MSKNITSQYQSTLLITFPVFSIVMTSPPMPLYVGSKHYFECMGIWTDEDLLLTFLQQSIYDAGTRKVIECESRAALASFLGNVHWYEKVMIDPSHNRSCLTHVVALSHVIDTLEKHTQPGEDLLLPVGRPEKAS